MNELRIEGGQTIIGDGLRPLTVTTSGGLIQSVAASAIGDHRSPFVDATDLVVSPGLIDLQINGGHGIDLTTDPHRVWELGEQLPRYGVTSFLPTVITSKKKATANMIKALLDRPSDYVGAEPIGAHFEGPMISPERLGAHPADHVRPIEPDVIVEWSHGEVALVTLAPELPGGLSTIAALTAAGVVVALGHSNATAEQAVAGFDAGASAVTHLFNAMAPLGHRSPNLVGAALATDQITTTLIADGHHVDPLVVSLIWKAKGPRGLALVSDAVAAMGLGPGPHLLGDVPVTSDGETVRTADGTLAGAALGLDGGVRNLMRFTGCSAVDAVNCASGVPARVLAIEDRGALTAGGIADITLFDHDLRPLITLCGGRIAYVADGAQDRIPKGHWPEGGVVWK